jgi:hypothetical protein
MTSIIIGIGIAAVVLVSFLVYFSASLDDDAAIVEEAMLGNGIPADFDPEATWDSEASMCETRH